MASLSPLWIHSVDEANVRRRRMQEGASDVPNLAHESNTAARRQNNDIGVPTAKKPTDKKLELHSTTEPSAAKRDDGGKFHIAATSANTTPIEAAPASVRVTQIVERSPIPNQLVNVSSPRRLGSRDSSLPTSSQRARSSSSLLQLKETIFTVESASSSETDTRVMKRYNTSKTTTQAANNSDDPIRPPSWYPMFGVDQLLYLKAAGGLAADHRVQMKNIVLDSLGNTVVRSATTSVAAAAVAPTNTSPTKRQRRRRQQHNDHLSYVQSGSGIILSRPSIQFECAPLSSLPAPSLPINGENDGNGQKSSSGTRSEAAELLIAADQTGAASSHEKAFVAAGADADAALPGGAGNESATVTKTAPKEALTKTVSTFRAFELLLPSGRYSLPFGGVGSRGSLPTSNNSCTTTTRAHTGRRPFGSLAVSTTASSSSQPPPSKSSPSAGTDRCCPRHIINSSRHNSAPSEEHVSGRTTSWSGAASPFAAADAAAAGLTGLTGVRSVSGGKGRSHMITAAVTDDTSAEKKKENGSNNGRRNDDDAQRRKESDDASDDDCSTDGINDDECHCIQDNTIVGTVSLPSNAHPVFEDHCRKVHYDYCVTPLCGQLPHCNTSLTVSSSSTSSSSSSSLQSFRSLFRRLNPSGRKQQHPLDTNPPPPPDEDAYAENSLGGGGSSDTAPGVSAPSLPPPHGTNEKTHNYTTNTNTDTNTTSDRRTDNKHKGDANDVLIFDIEMYLRNDLTDEGEVEKEVPEEDDGDHGDAAAATAGAVLRIPIPSAALSPQPSLPPSALRTSYSKPPIPVVAEEEKEKEKKVRTDVANDGAAASAKEVVGVDIAAGTGVANTTTAVVTQQAMLYLYDGETVVMHEEGLCINVSDGGGDGGVSAGGGPGGNMHVNNESNNRNNRHHLRHSHSNRTSPTDVWLSPNSTHLAAGDVAWFRPTVAQVEAVAGNQGHEKCHPGGHPNPEEEQKQQQGQAHSVLSLAVKVPSAFSKQGKEGKLRSEENENGKESRRRRKIGFSGILVVSSSASDVSLSKSASSAVAAGGAVSSRGSAASTTHNSTTMNTNTDESHAQAHGNNNMIENRNNGYLLNYSHGGEHENVDGSVNDSSSQNDVSLLVQKYQQGTFACMKPEVLQSWEL